ncbi:hypothetical protein VIGAN_02259700 [Vigna angularis var. angularis]|uniref:Uncharacterized protein n=1 Tax=Vigna angularis var. angularis TaxID=157739 RepID=A0A0S3RGP7_PHAAN|nr:hypothetical protein VIGAN_02259700 [Vigna angularis var. angularis]
MMLQLPPKLWQIIRLLIKRLDIVAAKTAIGVLSIDATERESEDIVMENLDETDGIVKESLALLQCNVDL